MTTPVLSHRTSSGAPRRPGGRDSGARWPGALAGAVGAGVALGLAEVIAGMAGRSVPSPVIAIGDAVVDLTPGNTVRTGIDTLGTADKPILLVSIVVGTLAVGAALGSGRPRRAGPLLGGFAALALVAVWAASRERGASPGATVAAYGLVAMAGAAVARGLGHLAASPSDARRQSPAAARLAGGAEPDTASAAGPANRRTFLALAGAGTLFAATTAIGGRRLAARSRVDAARRALVLPEAAPGTTLAPGAAAFAGVRGLSPFVTPNRDFYRIDTALVVPQVDPASWRLRVAGLVDEELSLSFDDLAAMRVVEQQVTLSCVSNEVGGDLVGNASWRGVPLADVLARAGARPEATQVVGESTDGFTAGFPLSVALDGRPALVAVGMNGEVLPVAHGFPCRLVVAGLYGYVSATKWLTELRLTRWEDENGYWIPRGWSKEGPIKTQSRIDVPRNGMELAVGTVAVAGIAWAPTRGIAAVEVQVDDEPWQPAELSPGPTDATWVQWLFRWPATAGKHRLMVRATDGPGAVQPAERSDVAPDGATGHHAIAVTVA